MPFFSILIPVYNVEKYLRECLDSVVQQDFTDYEVLMLDDGSTDSSGEICREYEKKYPHFHYYRQQNKGLLLTRRQLFQLMRGEYAICLDSDDYRLEGTLRKNYEDVVKSGCDLVIYRHNVIADDGTFMKESPISYKKETIFEGRQMEHIFETFIIDGTISNMWGKVVKKDIIDITADYSIYKDVKGEDVLQSIALFRNAKKIMYSPRITVCYRSSQNSRSNNFKFKYIQDLNTVYYQLYLYYLEVCAGQMKKKKQFFHRYLVIQRNNIVPLMDTKGNADLKIRALETLREAELMKVCKKFEQEKGTIMDRMLVSILCGHNIKKTELYFWLFGALRKMKHTVVRQNKQQNVKNYERGK